MISPKIQLPATTDRNDKAVYLQALGGGNWAVLHLNGDYQHTLAPHAARLVNGAYSWAHAKGYALGRDSADGELTAAQSTIKELIEQRDAKEADCNRMLERLVNAQESAGSYRQESAEAVRMLGEMRLRAEKAEEHVAELEQSAAIEWRRSRAEAAELGQVLQVYRETLARAEELTEGRVRAGRATAAMVRAYSFSSYDLGLANGALFVLSHLTGAEYKPLQRPSAWGEHKGRGWFRAFVARFA